jgi:hypothetical protein
LAAAVNEPDNDLVPGEIFDDAGLLDAEFAKQPRDLVVGWGASGGRGVWDVPLHNVPQRL